MVLIEIRLYWIVRPLSFNLIIVLIISLNANLVNRFFLSLHLTLQYPSLRALIILLRLTSIRFFIIHLLGMYSLDESTLETVPIWIIPVD